ncbi:MAG: hypothetical protein ACXVA9_03885 [Bdellovibrionales bacterium]
MKNFIRGYTLASVVILSGQVFAQTPTAEVPPATKVTKPTKATKAVAPAKKTVARPAKRAVAVPARKAVAAPTSKAAVSPAAKAVAAPATKAVAAPATKRVAAPAPKAVAAPAPKAVAAPATRALALPAKKAVTAPAQKTEVVPELSEEEAGEPKVDSSKVEKTVANTGKMNAPSKTKFQDLSIGLITWQEDIKATRGGESTLMQAQLQGLNFATSWNKFYTPTWREWYTVDFTLGQVKGKGATATIPDELKRQTFVELEFAPGLMWRTSPVSELGFGVPIAVRYIKWDLISGAGLQMDKKTSFSAGLSGTYVNRFSSRTSIHITVAHQHMWNAVVWTAAWNRVF